MDNGASDGKRHKTSKSRRIWTKREEEVLLASLKGLCEKGWRCDNGTFRPGYIAVLEKKMVAAFPETDLRGNPHIDSKIKIWKRHYNTITSMLMTSGFGFNETDMVVEVENTDIWEDYLKKDPDAKGMRNKPFPYYNSWCLIFGKDRATGEYAEGPADVERAFTTDVEWANDGPIDLTCLNDEQVPPPHPTSNKNATKTTRKRPRNNEVIASGINLIAESFATHCKETRAQMENIVSRIGWQYDLSASRRLLQKELATWPHITFQERIKAFAMLVETPANMDMFFSMTEIEKMRWVEQLLASPAP